MAETDYILVGRAVKEQGADRVQRIEPTACLIDRFTDVVGLLLLGPHCLIFERIVILGHRHGTAIEPDIDHLRHAAHGAPVGRVPGQLVDIGAMQVEIAQIAAHALGQLFTAGDAFHVGAVWRVTLPDGERGTPVAVAAQCPVDVVFQPATKAAILDMIRHPVDLLVECNQRLLVLAGADVPGALRVVK